jgi:hypothetical protein
MDEDREGLSVIHQHLMGVMIIICFSCVGEFKGGKKKIFSV